MSRLVFPNWSPRLGAAVRIPGSWGGLQRNFGAPLLVLLLALAPPAQAHRLKVFAAQVGERIEGSVYYPGGGKGSGIPVWLEGADGQRLAEVASDAEGRFGFSLSAQPARKVVAESADAHRAEFPLPTEPTPAVDIGVAVSAKPPAGSEPAGGCIAPNQIDEAIARQLLPLREQLDRLSEQRRMQDILGGIGYILGLFGVAAFLMGRRSGGAPR